MGRAAYLKSIRQPALVVNGGKDVIVYSVNSFTQQQHRMQGTVSHSKGCRS
jgi:hypothetical protein